MPITSLLLLCFAAAVLSLAGSFFFMIRGRGGRNLTRMLMLRVLFCVLLLLILLIGLYSGQVRYQAPWLS